jgi:DNA excision repair protein ERCC-2
LHSLTVANQWRVAVLVDEAHNLLERARGMYSMALHESDLQAVRADAPAPLKKTLGYLARCWKESWQDQTVAYQAYDNVPTKLKAALMRASAELTEHLALSPQQGHTPMQQLHFDILRFLGLADVLGAHSVFDISLVPTRQSRAAQGMTSVLCVRNVIPAPFLEQRFAASHSNTLFSATLSPWSFYRDTLGLPETTAWVDVESPFASEQLAVKLVPRISTRYQHRERSVQPIADLMAAQFRQAPGNYLSYFSSFDYLQQVVEAFEQRYPGIPVWRQSRNMDEAEKEAFLARFTEHSAGIGFAVLGGAFAEGIDLPGKRLIGAFVSTLGLPQVNPINERLKQSMATVFGARHGYDYTYLYPGIQKVVQAAGRVIRSHSDRGVVYLIDDRYLSAKIQALLPQWWQWTADSEPVQAEPTAITTDEPPQSQPRDACLL